MAILPSVDDAGVIAVNAVSNVEPKLTAQEEAMFIAGFQECIKYLSGQGSGSLLDEATQLLKDYEQWEADIISEDKLWWPNVAKDVMRGKIYDTMMELQEKRNNLLERLNFR